MVPALLDIAAERRRQVAVEGFGPEHDDSHTDRQMAGAAAAYLVNSLPYRNRGWIRRLLWQWDEAWFKPSTYRRDLIKAAALIVAEIERVDRTL